MNNKLMKLLGAVCIVIIACQLLTALVTMAFNKMVDALDRRIGHAIYQERLDVYEDLKKLHPSRIEYTRHGSPYVTESNNGGR